MTNNSDRNVWVFKAKQAIEEFGALDIKLPTNVLDGVKVMNRVAAAKPVKPSHTAIREAIVAGAAQGEIDRLLVADATYTRLSSEHAQGHIDSAGAVLAAIRDSADTLLPKLREHADAAIAKLSAIADLGGATLDHLVRAGRTADAALLADRDTTVAALTNCYRLRDTFLIRGGAQRLNVNGVSCATWRDPEAAAAHARGKTPADQFIAGLQAGLTPWFPSPDEAIEAATAIADRRAAARKAKVDAEFGTGSVVFLGA